jgi:glycosyltransferase involved in cell wall biosynthesis
VRPVSAATSSPPNPRLAIVACLKNEGEDLVEWLCFHRQVGVSDFVIYDNMSTDATRRILESVPFKDAIRVHAIESPYPQRDAFADALVRYRGTLDWVAFLDGDEFLVPLNDKATLLWKLRQFDRTGVTGFGINWRVFGSSGHLTRPSGLLTESFTRRAPDKTKPNAHVKSLVKIGKVEEMVTQHYFRVAGKYLLDSRLEPAADFKGVSPSITYKQGFAIHHYIVKSREQCLRKIARGRPRPASAGEKFRPVSYFDSYDRNEVEDFRAAEIIAPIRDEVLRLRDSIGRD